MIFRLASTNRHCNSVEQPTEREPQQQSGQQQARDNGRDELPQAHAVRFVNERTQVTQGAASRPNDDS